MRSEEAQLNGPRIGSLCVAFGGGKQELGRCFAWAIDPLSARPSKDMLVEILEAWRMVKMLQMRELVAEGTDKTRVLERLAGRDVA